MFSRSEQASEQKLASKKDRQKKQESDSTTTHIPVVDSGHGLRSGKEQPPPGEADSTAGDASGSTDSTGPNVGGGYDDGSIGVEYGGSFVEFGTGS